MSWEFVVLVTLLLWILWRVPVAWRTNLVLRRLWRQLNIIEANVRHVPLDVVEKEWNGWEEDARAARKGEFVSRQRGGQNDTEKDAWAQP
jgi:hypothetical protein